MKKLHLILIYISLLGLS